MNASMSVSIFIALAHLICLSSLFGANVTTGNYNSSRDNNQTAETILNQANIAGLKRQCLLPSTDEVLTQPLVYNGLVFVTSNDNKVYAYSDGCPASLVWSSGQLGPPGTTLSPSVAVGIIATPVIDSSTSVIYVLANISNVWKLYALNTANGSTFHAAITVSGTANGLTFNSSLASCRTALALTGGKIFFGCGGQCETGQVTPCNGGWVFCYSASDLSSCGVFATETTSAELGGIWMSGGGIAVDGSGNLWVISGNGDFNGTTRWGESMLKLSPSLSVADYLTPSNWDTLNSEDADFGGGRPILFGSRVIAVGKNNQIWLSSQSNVGHVQDCSALTIATQCFGTNLDKVFAADAYANNSFFVSSLFFDYTGRYDFNGATFNTTPTLSMGAQGHVLTLAYSSNSDAAGTGLLWETTIPGTDNANPEVCTLRALNPSSMVEIWSSGSGINAVGSCRGVSTPPPTVANGRVLVSTSAGVQVYATFSGIFGGSATFGGHLNQ